MVNYSIFRKTVVGKKAKATKRWYIGYTDVMGERKQKVCKNCSSRYEAEQYASKFFEEENLKTDKHRIRNIAREMYLPNSDHIRRREQTGKSIALKTLLDSKRYLEFFLDDFGDRNIEDLTVQDIMNRIWNDDRHGSSWKNSYLKIVKEVYEQAEWQGIKVTMPTLKRVQNDYTQADPFTLEEMEKLMKPENFKNESIYFLYQLVLHSGLRISEARGFCPSQFLPEHSAIIVNGFMDRDNKNRNAFCKKGDVKNPKWRMTLIPPALFADLKDFQKRKNIADDDFLFQYNGKPFRIEYAEELLDKAIEKAGIERAGRKLVPHSLRYTYVTTARESVDADVVRQMVGHTTLRMTDYYTRPGIESAARSLAPYASAVASMYKPTGKRT